jgi:cysteine desulfurase
MSTVRTYLDHNASMPLRPEARRAVVGALDAVGNASSVHAEGRAMRAIVEDAREAVAALVGVRASEVVFTSGATEANAWAVAGWGTILAPGIEHDSVLSPARTSGARMIDMAVGPGGVVNIEAVAAEIGRSAIASERTLIALQLANNETGVLQPLADVAALAAEHGIAVHCDAVQAAGRIAVDMRALGIATMSVSSHKLGGPQGIGALIVRDGVQRAPLISGGGQERRRRAGTENVAGIAGFGAAAEAARRDLGRAEHITVLRQRIEEGARSLAPATVVIGETSPRLGNTACLALPGRSAETLVIQMDLAGVAISAGAACSSGKVGTSHVLAAMQVPADIARGAVRVSLGWTTTQRDVDAFLAAWARIAAPETEQCVA